MLTFRLWKMILEETKTCIFKELYWGILLGLIMTIATLILDIIILPFYILAFCITFLTKEIQKWQL